MVFNRKSDKESLPSLPVSLVLGLLIIVQAGIVIFYLLPVLKERIESFNGAPPQLQTFYRWLEINGKSADDIGLSKIDGFNFWKASVDGIEYILMKDGDVAVIGSMIDLSEIVSIQSEKVVTPEPMTISPNIDNSEISALTGKLKQRMLSIDEGEVVDDFGKVASYQYQEDGKNTNQAPEESKKTKIRRIGYDADGNLLSAETTQAQTRKIFENIVNKPNWSIKYDATSEEVDNILVFSDHTCGFCRRLHAAIPTLNKNGISVTYLFYPRAVNKGVASDSARMVLESMKNAWCAKDQKAALDKLYSGQAIPFSDCDINGVEGSFPGVEHFILGNVMNLTATPYTITSNGKGVTGFSNIASYLNNIR